MQYMLKVQSIISKIYFFKKGYENINIKYNVALKQIDVDLLNVCDSIDMYLDEQALALETSIQKLDGYKEYDGIVFQMKNARNIIDKINKIKW